MTHSALSFWQEDLQPRLLFLRGMLRGINVRWYAAGGW